MSRLLIGIAWFTSEQWPEVQRSMVDKSDETYSEWLSHAEDLEAKLKKEGQDVARVPMDIGDFEIWCIRKGKKRDASARSEYSVEKIASRKNS